MRRIALTVTVLALTAASPGAARAQAPEVPELGAELTACVTGADAASRSATFRGSMAAVEGSSVLAMRFDLERRSGRTWKRVAARTLGRYERSAPGAAGFVYDKRVTRLAAPALYRATVRFRWYKPSGRLLKEVKRRSAACREPERRPDLAPVGITPGAAVADGQASYAVDVRNDGLSAVLRPFRVELRVDGVALTPQSLPGLGAGQTTTVLFFGPACRPGQTLRATVDGAGVVAERDEDDNALEQRCVAG